MVMRVAALAGSVAMVAVGVWQFLSGARAVGFGLIFVGLVAVGAVWVWWREREGDTALAALLRALAELFQHFSGV